MQGTARLACCFSSVNIFQQADFNFSGTARHQFQLQYLTPSLEKFGNGLNRRMNVLDRHYIQKGLEMVGGTRRLVSVNICSMEGSSAGIFGCKVSVGIFVIKEK